MKLYRFSPITNATECNEALYYTHTQLKALVLLITGRTYKIDTLKLFAHYLDEHVFIKDWVNSIGKVESESESSYYVRPNEPMQFNEDLIELLGVRVADPYRSQVGCGDYAVEDYDAFKAEFIGLSPFVREVSHPEYEMLELFHPDFDVLGYVVKLP